MTTRKDHLKRRCPRLGGPVSFYYCRLGSEENRPCFKILDCWWEAFDVVSHMKSSLPEEQFEDLEAELGIEDDLKELKARVKSDAKKDK